jgi:hypothetical protein
MVRIDKPYTFEGPDGTGPIIITPQIRDPTWREEAVTNSLEAVVGHWNTTGRSVAPGENMDIKGMDKYEWLPGRHFIVHHVDVWMGEDKVNVIEVIGPCTDDVHEIPMHSFDNEGNHTVMAATRLDEGVWRFAGD